MSNVKNLTQEIATLRDLKTVIESYEEIAAMRTRKVKKSVLQSRDFLSGLSDIYRRVMFTYNLYTLGNQGSKQKKSALSFVTNGKTVAIFLSANSGLYGDIIRKTFDLFAKNVVNNSYDLVVVGKIGKNLCDNYPKRMDYTYFEGKDTGIDASTLVALLNHVLKYSNIVIYHGMYISMLSQQPTATFVTGKVVEPAKGETLQELRCIIEPSVEEVAAFFEKQIIASIFEQTVYESSLSKFASRMLSLNTATDNITTSITKVNFSRIKAKHMVENFNQIERLSGISLWN